MPDAPWKAAERTVARKLGGTRVGPLGRTGPDVAHPWLAVEVKYRRRLPEWLKRALAQVRRCAKGRLPMVVLREKGSPRGWVLLSLDDFCEWFGEAKGGEG